MSISDGGYSVADVRIAGITGVRGVGFSRLFFSLELNIRGHEGRQPARIGNPLGFIYVGRTQSNERPLGVATFETHWFTEQRDYVQRDMLGAYVDLSGEQLDALERMREGGSLFFKLDFRVLLERPGRGVERGDQQIWYEANLSSWAKVLEQLGYLELLLVGLELPLNNFPSELREAIEQVRNAQKDLVAGRYDSAVGRVRLAMEGLEAVLDTADARSRVLAAYSGGKESREGMSKRDRASLVRIAIRHYTHLAHHLGNDGCAESFSRHDAVFALAAVAAAIWDAIGEVQRGRAGE